MVRLKKLLPDSSKNRRSRRIVLNVQITFFSWLVELLGFLTFAVGAYILGHENGTVTLMMQTFTMILYAILLPCSVLVNSTEVKDYIAESTWWFRLINLFGCQPKVYAGSRDDEESVDLTENNNAQQDACNSSGNHARQFGRQTRDVSDKKEENFPNDEAVTHKKPTSSEEERPVQSTDLEILDLEILDK